MKAELARPHARGIDTVQVLSTSNCQWLVQNHYDFVIRYLYGRYAVSDHEIDCILNAGLALMLCTPSRSPGWRADGLGNSDGFQAVASLTSLTVPKSVTTWIDLEGCISPAVTTSDWIDTFSLAIRNAGHEAGLYVGANPGGLDSETLWKRPHVTRYWRSGSRVPEPANRGWCMQQLRPLDVKLGPIHVDHDVIETDFKGGLPTWIVK